MPCSYSQFILANQCNNYYFVLTTVKVITPSDPDQHRCCLALRLSCSGDEVCKRMLERGIAVSDQTLNILSLTRAHNNGLSHAIFRPILVYSQFSRTNLLWLHFQ